MAALLRAPRYAATPLPRLLRRLMLAYAYHGFRAAAYSRFMPYYVIFHAFDVSRRLATHTCRRLLLILYASAFTSLHKSR